MSEKNEEMTIQEKIQEANKGIKTTPIHNKEYAEVPQRVKAFRQIYPEGAIETEIVSIAGGVVIMKATVKGENGTVLATGYAYEKEGSSNINKTSYIENCETSAVGRALGFCGLGIDNSIASYEEVETARLQQGDTAKASPAQITYLKKLHSKEQQQQMLEFFKIETLDDLTVTQASQLISRARAELEKRKNNEGNNQ